MKNILFLIKNDHNLILSSDQKRLLKVKLESYKSEEIIKVIKNYTLKNKTLIFDDIMKDEIFFKYLNYDSSKIDLPDYLDQLSVQDKKDLLDCHNYIMSACCGKINYIYESLIKKLFDYFTQDKIPFWCMSGVLYHDILKMEYVPPGKVIYEMNKKDLFIHLCRKQFKRNQIFRQKDLSQYGFGKELSC